MPCLYVLIAKHLYGFINRNGIKEIKKISKILFNQPNPLNPRSKKSYFIYPS
jgi:hypothetical protein